MITKEMIEALRKSLNSVAYVSVAEATDALTAAFAAMPGPAETLESYFARQIEWSRQTFGPAFRTKGVIDHIRKELKEIEQAPHDLSEWIDVVILAMDGFWRHGGEACNLLPALVAKQQKNMARTWPDWRAMSEDSAIEHDRSGEPRALTPAPDLASENERLRKALEMVAHVAGNIPDDILCRATGANDARYRGGLVCSARDIARAALERT